MTKQRKKASEIFGPVDPHLKVIDGGTRRRRHRRAITQSEWDQAEGVICPLCRRETLRLKDGLCSECAGAKEAERIQSEEDKTMRRHYSRKLREGVQNLHQMKEGRL